MFVFDLVVTRKYWRLEIRQNLHSASCSFDHCHFHRYHFYPKAENHRHWLTEAGETPTFDRFHSGHHSDDHPANFADSMLQSICHHFLSETDPDFAGLADAVAVLANLLDVTVEDAGQESAERLVDLPRWLDLCFGIEVEMCRIRKETRYEDGVTKSARFRLCPSPQRTWV